ncbi:MAG TPA: hypothetical protein PK385_11395 [Spirochaetota bacterium]|jgi:tetratricopeptide (TPR) repeat protein|nr:MAG: Tetratricopeptide repeat protein [Spirochaetes bacterium ADurb.Bin133]HNZ27016.1 hypothetical protein [Spirochaetota bacterium]HOF01790.1 hypothetical protein [Spirochaetota bacterium]HOS33492.1 hypothetical protein [Spirochaetota bacterium]HOS56646.1 hypothetical protein [Spirochaetota bacterium]
MDVDSKILFQFANTSYERLLGLEKVVTRNQIDIEKIKSYKEIYIDIIAKIPRVVLKNNRNIPYLYYFYGKTLYLTSKTLGNKEQIENSIRLIKTAIKNTQPNDEASIIEYMKTLIDMLIAEGKHNEAILFIIQYLKYFPRDKYYLKKAVKLFIKINKKEEALQYLKKITSADPYDHESYTEVGKIYLSLKKYDEALQAFQRSRDLEPKFPDNYKYIGKILLINNRKALAGSNFKTAIARKNYNHDQYKLNLKTYGKNSNKIDPRDDERTTLLFIYDIYIDLIKCGENFSEELKQTEDRIISKGYLTKEQIESIKKRYGLY